MSLSPRRTVFALAIFAALPLLVACPKKDPPVVDSGPPPPVEEASTQVLLPLEEDAGPEAGDADAEAGKKFVGSATSTNVARLKQCCNQLSIQAKAMGSSPEAGIFQQAAAQCTQMATAAGTGSAPELGVLKTVLAGRTIPPVCSGF